MVDNPIPDGKNLASNGKERKFKPDTPEKVNPSAEE